MNKLAANAELARLGEEMLETEQQEATPQLTDLLGQYKNLALEEAKLAVAAKKLRAQMGIVKAELLNVMIPLGIQNVKLADGTLAQIQKTRKFGLVDNSYRQEAIDWILQHGGKYFLNPIETAITNIANECKEGDESLPDYIVSKESEFVVVKGIKGGA